MVVGFTTTGVINAFTTTGVINAYHH